MYRLSAEEHAQVSLVFSVSKPAVVTVRVGAVTVSAWRPAGRHVLLWRPGAHTPSTVVPSVSAVDYAGNASTVSTRVIRLRRDRTPPVVEARLFGNALFWQARDDLSRTLRGVLVGSVGTTLRDLRGSGVLSVLAGAPPACLVVADSSGNSTVVRLSGAPCRPSALPALAPPPHEALVWIR
jgi:hypothetical protein